MVDVAIDVEVDEGNLDRENWLTQRAQFSY